MTHTALDQFRSKFRVDELHLVGNEAWDLSVRPSQITLGSMVLSSAKGRMWFADLSSAESSSMVCWFGVAEAVAKEYLGAARINAACLMMKDPILHFHIIPRYPEAKVFGGKTWRDPSWPGPPDFGAGVMQDDVLALLTQRMKEWIGARE